VWFVGAFGLLLPAHTPNDLADMEGLLIVGGSVCTMIRSVSVIWENRRATRNVRATVRSFLGRVESVGGFAGGLALVIVAQASSIRVPSTCSSALVATAGLLVARSTTGRALAFDPGVADG